MASSLAEEFQANLRTLRSRRKLTQQALADRLEMTVSYVSMLESGQRVPPLRTVERVARALGVRAVAMLQRQVGA